MQHNSRFFACVLTLVLVFTIQVVQAKNTLVESQHLFVINASSHQCWVQTYYNNDKNQIRIQKTMIKQRAINKGYSNLCDLAASDGIDVYSNAHSFFSELTVDILCEGGASLKTVFSPGVSNWSLADVDSDIPHALIGCDDFMLRHVLVIKDH